LQPIKQKSYLLMKFSARKIAEVLQGDVVGDPDIEVFKVSKIEEGEDGSISFLANPKYESFIYSTKASIVIVNKDFNPEKKVPATLIRVEDAYSAFARLLEVYNEQRSNKTGISEKAYIHPSSKIGENVYIGEFVVVGENVSVGANTKIYANTSIGENVEIGSDSLIYAGVRIYNDCRIGNDVTLHSGVVIGSDGFGFAPQSDNQYKKVIQSGNVIIEDRVEIGSNTTIDRATLGSTIIRKGVKLDNLIQIAHNVEIGENTVIAAQTGISGSTKIGANCMIAGQVGIIGHINIADDVKIAAQSGIGSDIKKKGAIYMGSPAFEVSEYKKSYIYFRRLPRLVERLEKLEKLFSSK
jgi:UDP-3-O-[3-hydroxymyristoyl] glucosamine N-acyltransferase